MLPVAVLFLIIVSPPDVVTVTSPTPAPRVTLAPSDDIIKSAVSATGPAPIPNLMPSPNFNRSSCAR